MNATRIFLGTGLVALLLGAPMAACSPEERPGAILDGDDTITTRGGGGTGGSAGAGGNGGSRAGAAGAILIGGSGGAGGSADADAGVTNCGEIACRGAGRCVLEEGRPRCVCDFGYQLAGGECSVDPECIQLKILEEGCRQRVQSEPSLGMFFGVETCAGTAVLPAALGDLSEAFTIFEDDNQLGEESAAVVLAREVESYVAIALDLSESVASDEGLLDPLINELKGLVRALEPEAGEPPVSVQLIVFGRTVHTDVAFTQSFQTVIDRLDEIQQDPSGAVVEPGGTNLIGAVNRAIDETQAAMNDRAVATSGGVVTTGTVVAITDGDDTSGSRLIGRSPWINRITIGISSDIDDAGLTGVGRDGSFLAPNPADWTDAFARVAQRVDEYPDRSYLLGYCSPAVEGRHDVRITLANQITQSDANCNFDAAQFGVGAGACTDAFLANYCSDRSCGTYLACGVCGPDAGAGDDDWAFTR